MDNEAQEKIKALTMAYAAQLPKRVQEIELAWLKVKEHKDKDILLVLIRYAHTLCGTSGTYGYTLISKLAKTLEKNLIIIQTENMSDLVKIDTDRLILDLNQLVLHPPERQILPALDVNASVNNEEQVIYILDNNIEQINLQIEQLRELKYTVKSFDDIADLRLAVDLYRPDVIIIDVYFAEGMSDNMIKKFQEELILIVYTAQQDELVTRLLAIRHGGQAFVVKPFEVNALLRITDNLFEAKRFQNDRILIVDDSEFLADYYATLLEDEGLVCEKITDPKQFLAALQEFQPDLILMDVNMPFCSGTELAQIVNQQEKLSGIPIIFLSTIAKKSKQLEVLSFAGDDFLTKPVHPRHLIASVRHRLMRSRMIRSRMIRDGLTNLYNHTMIHHLLDREVAIAERYNREVSVILFDIDHFKIINDTYGHQAGDKILKALSLFLQKNLRKSDLAGRYGGEEFLVVLPNTKPEEALSLADDLRHQFSMMPHWLSNKELFITISAGIANYPAVKMVGDLIKSADDALYRAKKEGRNRVFLSK